METLEELRAIVDNAPEDGKANEFREMHGRCKYYRYSILLGWFYFDGGHWIPIKTPSHVSRSLSDIKRIIELEEKLEAFADDISDCECLGGVAKTLRDYGL